MDKHGILTSTLRHAPSVQLPFLPVGFTRTYTPCREAREIQTHVYNQTGSPSYAQVSKIIIWDVLDHSILSAVTLKQ